MTDTYREPVDRNAKALLKRILGSYIFGVEVTAEDVNAMVLAAYLRGHVDEFNGVKDHLSYFD